MNIDRIQNLASQRRALQAAADERRLKANLARDAEQRDATARRIIGESFRRAFANAVEHGLNAERPRDDKAALRPHPSDEGRKPLVTNWPDEGRKVYKRSRASQTV